jgi:hypothetical protein
MAQNGMPAAWRLLDQVECNLRFRAKRRILLSPGQPLLGRVGHHMQRVVVHFVGPQRGHGDDAVVDLADRAQVLARHMIGGAALLAVPRVIDDQHTVGRWSRGRLGEQQRQAPGIDRFGVPGGLGEEKLQPLHLGGLRLDQRLGAHQCRERLGPVAREQQARQVGAKAMALGRRLEQGIELHRKGLQWPRCRRT